MSKDTTLEEFKSFASHEIRNQLATIYGYVQLLHKRKDYFKDDEKKWIEELFNETKKLESVIESVFKRKT